MFQQLCSGGIGIYWTIHRFHIEARITKNQICDNSAGIIFN